MCSIRSLKNCSAERSRARTSIFVDVARDEAGKIKHLKFSSDFVEPTESDETVSVGTCYNFQMKLETISSPPTGSPNRSNPESARKFSSRR